MKRREGLPEGGTHNFWVEGDVLNVAYYNQGVRVGDISGELLGNLYTQDREIAYFLPSSAGVRPVRTSYSIGVDPLWWTPYDLHGRCSRCRREEGRTRRAIRSHRSR